MRILVTDGMDKTAMAELREMGHEVVEQFYEPDQLGKALRDFDVVVVRSKTKVRANHIDEAKGSQLKLIIRGGVGVDNIDVDYAKANGIDVKNTPKASSQSVAELAMGHMFSCARYISIAGHTMREDKWEKKAYGKGIELQGKTLGIVGFGRIGQHLGVMAKAIGMKVIAFDIYHLIAVFVIIYLKTFGIFQIHRRFIGESVNIRTFFFFGTSFCTAAFCFFCICYIPFRLPASGQCRRPKQHCT